MAQRAIKVQKAVIPEHAASLPSAAEQANVAVLADLLKNLKAKSSSARPRSWISRVGALLRQVRGNRGQKEVADAAGVTQPYLSRLENGLLPKRGPTSDVLFRCAEAMECDIEIVMRSKKDGKILGAVSSADLDKSPGAVEPLEVLEINTSFSDVPPHRHYPTGRTLKVVFEHQHKRAKPVIWMALKKPDGRVSIEPVEKRTVRAAAVDEFFKAYLDAAGLVPARSVHLKNATAVVTGTRETQTVKIGEHDVIVIGNSE
jgi:transcriptional regulator with XRE-family HTH domain